MSSGTIASYGYRGVKMAHREERVALSAGAGTTEGPGGLMKP